MDIVKYISRYIPQWIEEKGKTYYFILFPNHPHHDFRFCYTTWDRNETLYLYENAATDSDLLQSLKELREELKRDGHLNGDYATKEGYTIKKYNEWQDGFKVCNQNPDSSGL